MEDPEGRWFVFAMKNTDFVILESKDLPQHLKSFENADVPVTLQSLVNDMEDLGEVICLQLQIVVVMLSFVVIWLLLLVSNL